MTDTAAEKEMQKALEADGEKLRQLTGEDHGPFTIPKAEEGTARALIEAYFSAVFEMVDPKIFADDLMECLSAKGFKIVAREPTEAMYTGMDLHDWGDIWRAMWDAAP